MRTIRIAQLAGSAAIAMAACTGLAEAGSPETHVLTVRLPDGQVEQIRYVGDVPPTVILAPDPVVVSRYDASPFAMLDQMAVAMDQQAAAMLRSVGPLTMADVGGVAKAPEAPGTGFCMRSVQITYSGNGQGPHVVSHTSGDCGPSSGSAAPTALPERPMPDQAPKIIEAKAVPPYQGLIHTVGDWQR